MPQSPRDPNWNESTGELVIAWNLDGDEELREPNPTGTPDLRVHLPSILDRTIEPGFGIPEALPDWDQPADLSFQLNLSAKAGPEHVGIPPTRNGMHGRAAADGPIPFPSVGEYFAGFLIRSELGRGAFGRVYLAEQSGLANRLVALKVSRLLGEEPRNLARLQHTHIVPIHSVHDDPTTGLRLLCMPFVGGANLAQILEQVDVLSPAEGTGRSLLQALDQLARLKAMPEAGTGAGRNCSPAAFPAEPSVADSHVEARSGPALMSSVRGSLRRYLSKISIRAAENSRNSSTETPETPPAQPARRFLDEASFVQAAVWIAARLAEALEHAHDRGLLHRDIKPSNILIAGDGTPMLLDFNLSADARSQSTGEEARALLGGTLPYMSPEHLDAFNPWGTTPASAVDERSDIYALGLILFEMVAGRPPFDEPPPGLPMVDIIELMTEQRSVPPPSARAINPEVPWSVESVVRKCIEPAPALRYQRAGDLAEDLRRLLDDRPLRHAPELSLRERAAKWARRHPRETSSTSIALVSLGLIAGLGATIWGLRDHVEGLAATTERAAFADAFRECQLRLNTATGPSSHVDRGLSEARNALQRYGVLTRPDWTAEPLVTRLAPAERKALLEEMSELVQLTARAQVFRAEQSRRPSQVRAALADSVALLDAAERFDPAASSALFEERARALAALGQTRRASVDRARAAQLPCRSARDFYLSGTARLARHDHDGSEFDLERAVALDPRRFWAWFALGICHHEQGRYSEAAGDFGVCSALFPEFAWPHLNRGLALAAGGRLAEARFEYDRALELSPNFLDALVNRGLALLESGDAAKAFEDLDRAIQLGKRDSGVQAARAAALSGMGRHDEARREFDRLLDSHPEDTAVQLARGYFRIDDDPQGARADFLHVLSREPSNARAHHGLALLWRASNPIAALRSVERALASTPNFLDAIELRALLLARRGDPAAESDVDRLVQAPSARRLYHGACALSILSKSIPEARYKTRSLDLLRRALALGFPAETARADPDLDHVRPRTEFAASIRSPETPRPGQ